MTDLTSKKRKLSLGGTSEAVPVAETKLDMELAKQFAKEITDTYGSEGSQVALMERPDGWCKLIISSLQKPFSLLHLQARLLDKFKVQLLPDATEVVFGHIDKSVNLSLVFRPVVTKNLDGDGDLVICFRRCRATEADLKELARVTVPSPQMTELRIYEATTEMLFSVVAFAKSYKGRDRTPKNVECKMYRVELVQSKARFFWPFGGGETTLKMVPIDNLDQLQLQNDKQDPKGMQFCVEIAGWDSASLVHMHALQAMYPKHVYEVCVVPPSIVRVFVRHARDPTPSCSIFKLL